MKKIYVGNLAYSIEEEALRERFEKYGDISEAVVIKERETGRSKGFGFVTFAESAHAEAAVAAENGTDMDGRTLRVSIAREGNARRDDSGGDRGGGGRW